MNSRDALIVVVCVILLCAGGVLVWKLATPSVPEPVIPLPPAKPAVAQPPAPPRTEPPKPIAETPLEPKVEETPVAAEPKPAPSAPDQTNTLTAETLTGTKWEDGPISVKFLPDGKWEMNGRVCAKWEVDGNRVRIYDDNGEEHFVDIVDDTLEFEGKKIGRVKN